MNIFDFENRLKNYTSNSKGDVDMDRLLKDLNIKPQAKTNSRFAYYFFAAILTVGLSYIGYSIFLQSPMESASNQEVLAPNPIVLSQDHITQANSNVVDVDNSISSSHPNIKEERNEAISSKDHNKVKKAPVQKVMDKVSTNLIEQNSNSTLNIEDAYITPIVPAKHEEIKEENKTEVSKLIADTKIIESYPNQQKAESLKKSIENLDLLPLAAFGLFDYDDKPNFKKLKKEDCPRFGERLWHLSIIPEIGYAFPMKRLRLNDTAFASTFNERVDNENTIEGINASLSLQFKNEVTGLYVKPGIAYTQINERLNFTETEIVLDSVEVQVMEPSQTGDSTLIFTVDSLFNREIITRSKVNYQLHEFDLPIAIGYTIQAKKFSFDVEAGLKISFLQRTTGQILSDLGNESGEEFADLESDPLGLFANSIGLGFFGGVLVKYPLSARSAIYLAPRYSFNTLSYSSNSNPINQRYNVFSINAGLIYHLY